VSTASPTELHRHWLVNTLGPIVLFQSFLPLLAQSHLVPVFGCITTGAAQLSTMENLRLPNVAYGSSKVAANYVMKKIHLENEDMIAFPRESSFGVSLLSIELQSRALYLTHTPNCRLLCSRPTSRSRMGSNRPRQRRSPKRRHVIRASDGGAVRAWDVDATRWSYEGDSWWKADQL
jgi:hypothetical protein